MNINAQELTLVRKNMKFGETQTTTPQPTTVTEPPVTKPESGLNALEAQAQNNIAFQGVKMPQTIKKGMGKMMLLATLAVGSLGLASCDKDPYVVEGDPVHIENNVSVSVDFSLVQELINQMKEDREIDKQQHAELMAAITSIYSLLERGEISEGEYRKQLFLVLARIEYNQEKQYAQLIANGKSQEEANAILSRIEAGQIDILARLEKGEITFQEARAEWEKLLGSIDASLKDILGEVRGLRKDMNRNFFVFAKAFGNYAKNMREFANASLENDEKQIALLDSLNNNQKETTAKVDSLIAVNNEILEVVKDPTKFNELMTKLDSMARDDEEYQTWLKQFANEYKLDLTQLLEDWKKDNERAQKATIGAINNVAHKLDRLATIVKTGLRNANDKLSFIARYLPQLKNDPALKAEIEKLADAIEKNTAAVEENTTITEEGLTGIENELSDVNGKLDTIIGKFDTVIDQTAGLTDYFTQQQINWTDALKNLEKGNQILDDIRTNGKITNGYLEGYKAEFQEVKENQKLSNSYLYILVQKQGDLEKAIKELNIDVNGGMTREEFVSAMEERDAKLAAEFKEFIKDYGFDKVPGNVQTIADLLGEVKDAINNQKDYSGQLDRIVGLEEKIYNFLENMDLSNPADSAKLDKLITILENWKHNCDCVHDNNSSDKENNDESVKDLEDTFS